jgi:hypothetical protein
MKTSPRPSHVDSIDQLTGASLVFVAGASQIP